jgi:hypothetical protein
VHGGVIAELSCTLDFTGGLHVARTAFFFCLMTLFEVYAWLEPVLTLRLGPQVFWFDSWYQLKI